MVEYFPSDITPEEIIVWYTAMIDETLGFLLDIPLGYLQEVFSGIHNNTDSEILRQHDRPWLNDLGIHFVLDDWARTAVTRSPKHIFVRSTIPGLWGCEAFKAPAWNGLDMPIPLEHLEETISGTYGWDKMPIYNRIWRDRIERLYALHPSFRLKITYLDFMRVCLFSPVSPVDW